MNQPPKAPPGRRTEPRVPVLAPDGQTPLTPCTLKRARQLVERRKAKRRWQAGLWVIVLRTVRPNPVVDPLALHLDPGHSHSGLVVVHDPTGDASPVFAATVEHRTNTIVHDMRVRRNLRSTRRCRKTRSRRARFSNRRRKTGWLPPSYEAWLAAHRTWAKRLCSVLPITEVRIESTLFDVAVLARGPLEGAEYQRGPLYQCTLWQALVARDDNRCVYCRGEHKVSAANPLTRDHVVPRSRGGADRLANLVLACKRCNSEKGTQALAEYVTDPKQRAAIEAKLDRKPLHAATLMNRMRRRLVTELGATTGLPVHETDAGRTAATRQRLKVPKSHTTDALVLGEPRSVRLPARERTIAKRANNAHRRVATDRHGTPKGKAWRRGWSEHHKAGRTGKPTWGPPAAPGHSPRRRQTEGLRSGDTARLTESAKPMPITVAHRERRARAAGASRALKHVQRITPACGYHIGWTPQPRRARATRQTG